MAMAREPDDPPSPDRIPAAEWRAPDPIPLPSGSLARSLAGARTGFLRYAVAGGAMIGAFASTFATGAEGRREINGTMVIGTFVGFGVGMLLGWTTFRVVERVAIGVAPHRPVASVVAFGLALPAYVVAGVVASIAGAAVREMPAADIASLTPDVVRLLVFSGFLLLPIAVVFGRSDRTRPASLMAALSQVDDLSTNPSGTSRTFWGVAVALVMFVAGFGLALVILLAVTSIAAAVAPGAHEAITRDFGALFGVALLVLWVVVGVVGWKLTMRFIDWIRASQ
jgi:hypothetical protein